MRVTEGFVGRKGVTNIVMIIITLIFKVYYAK